MPYIQSRTHLFFLVNYNPYKIKETLSAHTLDRWTYWNKFVEIVSSSDSELRIWDPDWTGPNCSYLNALDDGTASWVA